jgi:hypothetical protein
MTGKIIFLTQRRRDAELNIEHGKLEKNGKFGNNVAYKSL